MKHEEAGTMHVIVRMSEDARRLLAEEAEVRGITVGDLIVTTMVELYGEDGKVRPSPRRWPSGITLCVVGV